MDRLSKMDYGKLRFRLPAELMVYWIEKALRIEKRDKDATK